MIFTVKSEINVIHFFIFLFINILYFVRILWYSLRIVIPVNFDLVRTFSGNKLINPTEYLKFNVFWKSNTAERFM